MSTWRPAAIWGLVASVLLMTGTALAGDKEAHTNALDQAISVVLSKKHKPEWQTGVGAPRLGGSMGVPQDPAAYGYPRFALPDVRAMRCEDYDEGQSACARNWSRGGSVVTLGGCACETFQGRAVNEPDFWTCTDRRLPLEFLAWNEMLEGNSHDFYVAEACNWSHFVDNSKIVRPKDFTGNWPIDTDGAFAIVSRWADLIPTAIEKGNYSEFRCDTRSWDTYLQRVFNSLHYAQDATSEHHKQGNLKCGPHGWNAKTSPPWAAVYDFRDQCKPWLNQIVSQIQGKSPKYHCDGVLVDPPGRLTSKTTLTGKAKGLVAGCNWDSPLACMGLERLLRHHCVLDEKKSIDCSGPANNHKDKPNATYCEGETYPATDGQDFLADAAAASVPVLEKAAQRWADVCQEPDDKCTRDQCNEWCRRSRPGPNTRGFCVNNSPDPHCELHFCECGEADDCGGAQARCCLTEPPCDDAGYECSPATGKCEKAGAFSCTDPPPATGDTSIVEHGAVAHDQRVSYTFPLNADQSVIIRLVDDSASAFVPGFVVEDPTGTAMPSANGAWGNDVALYEFRAPKTGTYTIEIYDHSGDKNVVGSYTLYIAAAPGANKYGTLRPGEVASGSIARGALDSYTFSARAEESVILRCADVDGQDLVPAVAVFEPSGKSLINHTSYEPFGNSGQDVGFIDFVAADTGTYTVVVFDDSSTWAATGRYNLYFAKAPGANKYGALVPGETAAGTLSKGAMDSYTFSASVGESVILRVADVDGAALVPTVAVFDPSGKSLINHTSYEPFGNNATDVAFIELVAAAPGTYTVLVYDDSATYGATGPYKLYFSKAPGANKYGALTPGEAASGTIGKGALDSYTFSANAGESVILRVADVDGGALVPTIAVFDPNGKSLINHTSYEPFGNYATDVAFIEIATLLSGTYTVLVYDDSANYGATGPYKLYFSKAPGANKYGALTPGEAASGTIGKGALDSYTFFANAGESIVLRAADVDGGALVPTVAVFDPSGRSLINHTSYEPFGNYADDVALFETQVLTTGIYTVLVYDDSANYGTTGPYKLYFIRAPGANKYGALALGEVKSGTIAKGALDSYTFVAEAGHAVKVTVTDVDGSAFTPTVAAFDPTGKSLIGHTSYEPFGNSGADVAAVGFTPAFSGAYTVAVWDDSAGYTGTGRYTVVVTSN